MVGMVFDARQSLDNLGHPVGGPQGCAKVVGLRPRFKGTFQLAEVFPGQAALASGTTRLLECGRTMVSPSLMPAADRLTVDAKLAGDLSLT